MKTWVEGLIEEYSIGKKQLEKYRGQLNRWNSEEDRIVGEMISDMQYAIDWMKSGRRPGNYRGVDKRSAYQRRALLDMDMFPSIELKPKQVYLNEEQKKQLIDILYVLSHRERQCYMLHMAHGWSLQEIADELNIKKRTAQQYVDRAREKIKKKVS
jgi:positive control factor